ncbi:hypothetical protein NDU88_004865 [Pleurodeles waltl]|uniref:Uncharacterized protein n=1 Tax=Pleurodeles waltl TaxID=8319 RepID=A0AAV7MB53_PLEWA|nr:hypothetical protein NDU88_004865 [Pleurodeles waltl]
MAESQSLSSGPGSSNYTRVPVPEFCWYVPEPKEEEVLRLRRSPNRDQPDKSYAYSLWGTYSESLVQFGAMTIAVALVSFRYLGIWVYRDRADLLEGNLSQSIAFR